MKALTKYMGKQRLEWESAKRQGDPRFQKYESKLEVACNSTRGDKKVTYTPPSSTELEMGTNARRQRLRRALNRYHRYIGICSAVARSYALSRLSSRVLVDFFNESITVSCPLGASRCPCRGVRWNHLLLTWHDADRDDEEFLDEAEEFWDQCPVCKNDFDKRLVGFVDTLLGYCNKFMRKIQDDDMNIRVKMLGNVSIEANLVISAAEIELSLVPKIRALFADDNMDETDAPVNRAKAEIDKWITQKYSETLAREETKARRVVTRVHLNTIMARASTFSRNNNKIAIDLTDYGFRQPDEEESHISGG